MVRTLDPISSKKHIPIGTTVAILLLVGCGEGGLVVGEVISPNSADAQDILNPLAFLKVKVSLCTPEHCSPYSPHP